MLNNTEWISLLRRLASDGQWVDLALDEANTRVQSVVRDWAAGMHVWNCRHEWVAKTKKPFCGPDDHIHVDMRSPVFLIGGPHSGQTIPDTGAPIWDWPIPFPANSIRIAEANEPATMHPLSVHRYRRMQLSNGRAIYRYEGVIER